MSDDRLPLSENEPRWFFKVCAYGKEVMRTRWTIADIYDYLGSKNVDWSKVYEIRIEKIR